MGDADEAQAMAREMTLLRAQTLAQSGRAAEARGLLTRLWAEDPKALTAGFAVCEAAILAGDTPTAIDAFAKMKAHDPSDCRVHELEREIGLILFGRNQWEAAAPLLSAAHLREPWDRGLARAAARAARPDYLAAEIDDPVTGGRKRRYGAREGGRYVFVIDVVGTCNLRCPTCPVGNSPLGARKLGFMPYALFEEIVAKIARETPAPHPQINLFNWGEPLLHPDLPKMIALLKRYGFASHLSSNLNIKRGLREVIAADPDDLKISISGFSPETYDKTHKRGNLELVQKNMRALRRYLDETGARTRIWVGQHIYKSNQHESAATRAFALELGFEYAPIPAFYMPLERVVDHIEGRETPANDGILDDLLEAPHARLDGPDAPDPAYDCELRFNQTVINYDGSVALCCSVYDAPQMLGVQYLDESFAALEARKYAHSYCGTCQGYGLQFAPRAPMILPDGLPPNEARDAASL